MLALGIEMLRLHSEQERGCVQLTKELYPAIGHAVPGSNAVRAERCMRAAIETQCAHLSEPERLELYGCYGRHRPTVGEALHRLARGYELALHHRAELRDDARSGRRASITH